MEQTFTVIGIFLFLLFVYRKQILELVRSYLPKKRGKSEKEKRK